MRDRPGSVGVWVGKHFIREDGESGEQVRGVAAVNVHGRWLATKGNVEHDICVLNLEGILDIISLL